jgi:hypothetical protein
LRLSDEMILQWLHRFDDSTLATDHEAQRCGSRACVALETACVLRSRTRSLHCASAQSLSLSIAAPPLSRRRPAAPPTAAPAPRPRFRPAGPPWLARQHVSTARTASGAAEVLLAVPAAAGRARPAANSLSRARLPTSCHAACRSRSARCARSRAGRAPADARSLRAQLLSAWCCSRRRAARAWQRRRS